MCVQNSRRPCCISDNKTHHLVATRPFFPAANPPCVSSLQLKHSVKTLSQEVKVWKKKSVSVWVTHLKISPIFLLFFLLCSTDLWVTSPAGKVGKQPMYRGEPGDLTRRRCLSGDRSEQWGQVTVVIHTHNTCYRKNGKAAKDRLEESQYNKHWAGIGRATSTGPKQNGCFLLPLL